MGPETDDGILKTYRDGPIQGTKHSWLDNHSVLFTIAAICVVGSGILNGRRYCQMSGIFLVTDAAYRLTASVYKAPHGITLIQTGGVLIALAQWLTSSPLDLQGAFRRGFEPRHQRLGLTEAMKA
ncbi:hypothetical protein PoB_007500600 [Plakobranchus ocellatus]|uniref:Uncharacterized protein n=1 Tax=Plakobranchus ocellatus TaxID=259542 RepID=A0AAV4DWK1_9GAST|nr:hypothetical protein PoB_007500600 [Plakobranchus ocellatus]